MTSHDQKALNALFRTNFTDALSWNLNEVMAGRTRRLIINMPPRHLKSLAVSVAFPAFLLGHNPRRRIVCISYANDLAAKHAADFRVVCEAPSRSVSEHAYRTRCRFRSIHNAAWLPADNLDQCNLDWDGRGLLHHR